MVNGRLMVLSRDQSVVRVQTPPGENQAQEVKSFDNSIETRRYPSRFRIQLIRGNQCELLSCCQEKMRLTISCLLILAGATDAFAPSKFAVPPKTARSFGLDPSIFHDIPNHVQSLQDAFSSLSLSDAFDALPDAAAVSEAVQSAPAAASNVIEAVPEGAVDAAAQDNGWFGFLTGPTTLLLQFIHSILVAVGVSQDAWGVAIIFLTLLIKVVTFPLTKTQLESTNKMQVRRCCRMQCRR